MPKKKNKTYSPKNSPYSVKKKWKTPKIILFKENNLQSGKATNFVEAVKFKTGATLDPGINTTYSFCIQKTGVSYPNNKQGFKSMGRTITNNAFSLCTPPVS